MIDMPNLQRLSQDPAPKKIGARVEGDGKTTTYSIRRVKNPEKRRRNSKLPTRTRSSRPCPTTCNFGERRKVGSRKNCALDGLRFLHEALPERPWHEGAGTL